MPATDAENNAATKPRRKHYFIAGTDTDAGKTLVATGLLRAAAQQHWRTLAVKPVAAGAEDTGAGLRNDDAVKLAAEITEPLSYAQLNPVVFAPPIAPHIAAQQAGKRVTVAQLAGFCRGVMMRPADLVLIEGAGGWRVPVNDRESLADLAVELQTPVILVVGMKLGCLNHALLTAEAIRRDGLTLAAWVANHVDPEMACANENVASLEARLMAPCLGRVPHMTQGPDLNRVAQCFNLACL